MVRQAGTPRPARGPQEPKAPAKPEGPGLDLLVQKLHDRSQQLKDLAKRRGL